MEHPSSPFIFEVLMIVTYHHKNFPSGSDATECLGEVDDNGNIYLYDSFHMLKKGRLLETITILHESIHVLLGHSDSTIKGYRNIMKAEREVWQHTINIIGRTNTIKAMLRLEFARKTILFFLGETNEIPKSTRRIAA